MTDRHLSRHGADTCGPEPHTHTIDGMLRIRGCALLMDSAIVALIPESRLQLADRICELLARHGICDVPDNISPLDDPEWPCCARHRRGYMCSLPIGHDGPHDASGYQQWESA